MAYCRRCWKDGFTREGGPFGVCQKHRRGKCLICRAPSLGEEFCAQHRNEVQLAHWTARAEGRICPPERYLDQLEIRRQHLMDAKHMLHEAVEVGFQGLSRLLTAFWIPARALEEPQEERRAA